MNRVLINWLEGGAFLEVCSGFVCEANHSRMSHGDEETYIQNSVALWVGLIRIRELSESCHAHACQVSQSEPTLNKSKI